MSYLALARQWRPRTFSELLGQRHVTKSLIYSLAQERLHHAYLFSGTHGVGKTTVARLLAKALNCEKGVSPEPCLQCEACIAIEQGRFIDLIEVDGASRTRIEDTRDILENVQYAPTSGRYKIYLIDEVHMLSQHSFNALLKTLEEPPAHVKFLLATTDPQKLPVTVLSRCLQFHLKHLQPDAICDQLARVLIDEKLSYDLTALELLAKAAHGSMRDALSLLEQSIASRSGEQLLIDDVKCTLGYTQQDYALQLLQALAARSVQQLLSISRKIGSEGGHFHYVVDEMLSDLHQISIHQALPNQSPQLCQSQEIIDLSNAFTSEDVQLIYQIGIKGSEDMHLAPTLAIGFEMMLLRMYTFKPASKTKTPPLAYLIESDPSLHRTPENSLHALLDEPDNHPPKPQTVAPPALPNGPNNNTQHPSPQPDASDTTDWNKVLPKLKLSGLALNAAENAEYIGKSGGKITFRVAKGHQSLFTSAVVGRIEQALARHFNETIKLTINSDEKVISSPAKQREIAHTKDHQDAESALKGDAFFQTLQDEFSAELVKNSIASVKNPL